MLRKIPPRYRRRKFLFFFLIPHSNPSSGSVSLSFHGTGRIALFGGSLSRSRDSSFFFIYPSVCLSAALGVFCNDLGTTQRAQPKKKTTRKNQNQRANRQSRFRKQTDNQPVRLAVWQEPGEETTATAAITSSTI